MSRTGFTLRTASGATGLLLVVALAFGAARTPRGQASPAAPTLTPRTLTGAAAIRAELDARYQRMPGRGLAVTEATSTGVLESYSLLTQDLLGSRRLPANNGIYYAICPVRATCPYPAARFGRPASDPVPRRLALELALRTFLETSADLVVVALPTREVVDLVVQRRELAGEVDLRALAKALRGDPSRALSASLEALVDRLTRPRTYVALGLEETPDGKSSWAGMPRWPSTETGGDRVLLGTTTAPAPVWLELFLHDVQRPDRGGKVLALGSGGEGTFRSASPFCGAGDVAELPRSLSGRWMSGLRRLTCSDGSGSVTVRTWLMGMDEASASESGVWQIVEGTGDYASLRGKGAYARVVEGKGRDASARETWAGEAGLDAAAPKVAFSQISVARAPTPGWHVVRIALTARDGESPVYFLVSASNRFLLAARSGTTATGIAVVALRVHPGTGGPTIRLKLEASDRVGNTTTVVRTLDLPR